MALREKWGADNRVVEEDLRTVYERETITAKTPSGGDKYAFRYTRTRTKRYKYLGLTREAANACAAALNRLYNRVIAKQHLVERPDMAYYYTWFDDGIHTSEDPYYTDDNIVDRSDQLMAHKYKRVRCGEATPSYTGEGDAWDVDVTVDETLSAVYALPSVEQVGETTIWKTFEDHPERPYLAFVGLRYAEAEFYDDDDVGYGSPA